MKKLSALSSQPSVKMSVQLTAFSHQEKSTARAAFGLLKLRAER